jgi:hypothetical protein
MNYKLAEIFPWQHLVLAELPDDTPKPGALVRRPSSSCCS